MSYWKKLKQSLRAAQDVWTDATPTAPRAPVPLPAAFAKAPEAGAISPTPRTGPAKPKLWRVAEPNRYFIYEAFSHYEQLLADGRPYNDDWDPRSPQHLLRRRSQAELYGMEIPQLLVTSPLLGQLYWWWRKQEGNLGKQTPRDLSFTVLFINEEPVLVARTLFDYMGNINRCDQEHNGQYYHYITRLNLPQPLLTLRQTVQVTPALASSLRTMLMEEAQ